ncbi:SDR family NAD(P)-dependent oxidoreductase [Natronoglycomyces albus]|uniref:SDR family oxidoreductase n=1 Tax=Natronoglycomyces albus TaxID=2811108 RepID=A0A895XNU9_9ACTN|nr:SDR family oxidoreductase [Natronoglycomyces albus]QSB05059.1 SDR family oxidoreductase [Natronoglycomyces albus]
MMTNKTLLLTGASRGIGAATVRRFVSADNGYGQLALLARASDDFDQLIKTLEADNPHNKTLLPFEVDLGDTEALIDTVAAVHRATGGVDMLVNNAGYTAPAAIQQSELADFERTMSVNLYAPFILVRELLRAGNHFDLIVNIASTAGLHGRAGWLTYSASKAALINMSEVMKEELKIYGTRVACLAPGRCATALRSKLAPEEDPSTIMQPEHVAQIVEFLTTDASRLIDSERLVVKL